MTREKRVGGLSHALGYNDLLINPVYAWCSRYTCHTNLSYVSLFFSVNLYSQRWTIFWWVFLVIKPLTTMYALFIIITLSPPMFKGGFLTWVRSILGFWNVISVLISPLRRCRETVRGWREAALPSTVCSILTGGPMFDLFIPHLMSELKVALLWNSYCWQNTALSCWMISLKLH